MHKDNPCGLNRTVSIVICNECLAGTAKGYECCAPGCHYFQSTTAVAPSREDLEDIDMDVVQVVEAKRLRK